MSNHQNNRPNDLTPVQFFGILAVFIVAMGGVVAWATSGDEERQAEFRRTHAQEQAELQESLSAKFNLQKIEIPAEFYQLDGGAYTATIPTPQGDRQCIVNVTSTTHNYRHVALDCAP